MENLGVEALILGVTVGGSMAGLVAVALMLRREKPAPAAKDIREIVKAAPYGRIGNNLRVD